MRFSSALALALAVPAALAHNGGHHRRQAASSAPSSSAASTASASRSAASTGSAATTGTATTTGAASGSTGATGIAAATACVSTPSSAPSQWTAVPGKNEIPLASLTPCMPTPGPTMTLAETYTGAGHTPPWESAVELPSSTARPVDYPELDRIPPIDSAEVKAWIDAIDWTQVPDFKPTVSSGCASNVEATKDKTRCWWTCGGCEDEQDIVSCPTKYDWGLTYDDGPAPFTPTLLNYLAQENLTSTFFIIGSRAISRQDIVRWELMKGHQLSVHTWSHHALTELTNEQIVAELGWTKKVLKEITGITPNTMRPPFGDIDNRVRAISHQMGLTPIIWTSAAGVGSGNFDSNDWKIANPQANVTSQGSLTKFEQILDTANQLDTGFIALAHDLYQQAVDLSVAYVLPGALNRSPKLNLMSVIDCLGKPQHEGYIETASNTTSPSEQGTGTKPGSGAFAISAPTSLAVAALLMVTGALVAA